MKKKQKNPCIELICTSCEFFKEDETELECAALKALRTLLKRGIIRQEEIRDALR